MMNEIVQNGKNATSEIELSYRRYLVKVCMLIGLPFLAYFSIYDVIIGRYLVGSILFLMFSIILILYLYLRRPIIIEKKDVVYRYFLTGLFLLFGIYIVYAVGIEGQLSRIPWSYIFPVIVFFALGERTALIWVSILFFLLVLSVIYFPSHDSIVIHELKTRFYISYVLVIIVSFFFERLRRKYQIDLIENEQQYRALYEKSSIAEEVYRSLLHSSPDAIVTYDLEGNVRYLSPAFTQIFGWELEEVTGKPMPFLPDSEKEASHKIIKDLLEKGLPCQGFETKRFTKDGRVLNVSISASRYDDHNGKPSGILVILRDISERRRLESQLQQAQKVEAIGTLAGGIAHDFNNLMMGILGNINLMVCDLEESHPFFNKLSNIEKQIQSGSKLTGQLLGYARKGKYEVKAINLNKIVAETSETFGRTKKEITIRKNLLDDLYAIEADQGQIEQILLNLYVNAADAMPAGGDLVLTTKNTTSKDMKDKSYNPKPGNYIILSVMDTGIGIDDDTMERIFDPFFTTKEMGRGTGLGLASVYGIIKAHGGYVDVASETGHGTTFHIYLPATDKKIKEESKDPIVEIEEVSGTILLIDDEEMVVEVGIKMLQKFGLTVFAAMNGNDAVTTFMDMKDKVDLVILDMVMPGMSGGETFDQLKMINDNVKVLLSSGYSLDSQAKEIMDRGCDGFIQKPFNMNQLFLKVREVMN